MIIYSVFYLVRTVRVLLPSKYKIGYYTFPCLMMPSYGIKIKAKSDNFIISVMCTIYRPFPDNKFFLVVSGVGLETLASRTPNSSRKDIEKI